MTRLKMLLLALLSSGWLAPAVLAWNRLLAYLNDDLARLHFKSGSVLLPPDINEAANITEARWLLLIAAVWLGLVIFGWTAAWYLRRTGALRQAGRLGRRLRDREEALERQFQDLNAQINRCRDALVSEYGQLAAGQRGRAEERLGEEDRFDARFERLEGLLTRFGAEMVGRIETVEDTLRRSGEQIGHQFGDLREQFAQVQSVNQSNFGDLPPAAAPAAPLTIDAHSALAERLHQVVLNLSTLQEDLRIKDRELRRRLRNLPDAAAPAPRSQRAA
jgi:hypothetical protein